jgi:phage terminase Nu1 subunit (DNA packaging protein)
MARKTMLDELVEEAKASFQEEENTRRITEVLTALPSLDDKEFEALTAAYFEELKRRLARRQHQ